jgi:hypothetical protein
MSIDAKATVKIGPCARGGKRRVVTKAADHDVRPVEMVTPVGVLLPATNERVVAGVTANVTRDCLVDRLEDWWTQVPPRFRSITTLVLNRDHGPDCHRRRTQCMPRLVACADRTGRTIQLADYPPYHRKYNPIERCGGILERHGNGRLLDTLQGTRDRIETMTWRGVHPVVAAVTRCYHTGVRLTKEAMAAVERRLVRDPQLGRWFVTITPIPLVE